MEKYLLQGSFNLRKAMISAHDLRVESGRHAKHKLIRSERICTKCNSNEIKDDFHFILKCKLFEKERETLCKNVILNNEGFRNLSVYDKAIWLLKQENINILRFFA